MEYQQELKTDSKAIKITAQESGKDVGRVYLYILKNDLHKEPFGFLEDLFVEESHRKHGIGSELIKKAVEEARAQGCYKLIGNSRLSKESLHAFYERLGMEKWGYEFRLNFKQ